MLVSAFEVLALVVRTVLCAEYGGPTDTYRRIEPIMMTNDPKSVYSIWQPKLHVESGTCQPYAAVNVEGEEADLSFD